MTEQAEMPTTLSLHVSCTKQNWTPVFVGFGISAIDAVLEVLKSADCPLGRLVLAWVVGARRRVVQ